MQLSSARSSLWDVLSDELKKEWNACHSNPGEDIAPRVAVNEGVSLVISSSPMNRHISVCRRAYS